MIGSVIFGGVLLSYADIDDPWIFDECYIISRNDSCLDRKHDNCVVSVTALASTDPVWKEILLPTEFGHLQWTSVPRQRGRASVTFETGLQDFKDWGRVL